MKYKLVLMSAFIVASSLFGHAQDTLKMGLQECIDYGLKNSNAIANAKLEEQISKAKVGEVRAIGLPQISASAGIQHNLRLRDIYGQANNSNFLAPREAPSFYAVQGTNLQTGQTESIPAMVNGRLTVPEGSIFKVDNFFQLPNGADASLNISQIIFSGSYIVGLQAANAYKEMAEKSTKQSEVQTKARITKAYYFMLINLERLNLFDVNIARVDSVLSQTKALQRSGLVETIDVDRLEVSLSNLLTERLKFENFVVVSNIMLKFQMGMPISQNLILTEQLKNYNLDINAPEIKADFYNRIEYQQLKVSRRLQELALKNNRWSKLPTLIASANLGLFTQNSDLGKLLTGDNFSDKSKMWSNYGLVQLGLSVPIFGGGSSMYQTQQSKLKLKQLDNDIKDFENVIIMEDKRTKLNLNSSIYSLEAQKKNMQLAQRITETTRKKYKGGTGSSLEVITAESSLKESQINYYNALFDAINSKVEYDIATGNLK